jgi:tetratricopeptide (TPR) repeat protein
MEAVEQPAEKIAGELPSGSRVAIVAFESENGNLSDFIMEEITSALFDRGLEVANRQNLEYVYKELNFQMSGDVSDETAQSIGKFLAAELVITGQLIPVGGSYRYRTSAIHVEKATRDSVTRLTVSRDRETRRMVTALAKQSTAVRTAKYGVSEQTVPKTAGTFLDRGILFASRGDYEMAIADFTEALELNPDLSAAYVLRGRALYASASTVTSVGENFSGVGIISNEGQATAEQARVYEQAIEDFTQALRLDPNNVNIYGERGVTYAQKGDSDRAITDYNQAIRLNPNLAEAYISRGIAYAQKGDNDRAIADYNQAIRLNSNIAEAYNNCGIAYAEKGDSDRAIADYNQAIRLDRNNAPAYVNRGIAYYLKKNYNRAIADYDQAIRLNPNSAWAYGNRGSAYYKKGDINRAIADFDAALRLDPNDSFARDWREYIRQQHGR